MRISSFFVNIFPTRTPPYSFLFLVFFAFALPLSTSATSILAILLLLTWLLSGDMKGKFREIFNNPVAITVLLYIILHIIALLWSEDLNYGLSILKKQWKLLLFPVFLTLARKEHTKYYIGAFVAAIFLKACKAYMVWLKIITLPAGSVFTTVGTSHVIYNPMLALACYIILQNLLFSENKGATKYLQIALLLFLSCNMFITVGRTGQAVFFILLAVALIQYYFSHSKKMLIIALIMLPILMSATYITSNTFKERFDTAVTEIQNHKSYEITSVGIRVWLCKNTLLLIKENWLIGTGTGDFPNEYSKINQIHSPLMPGADNPHNQYLLTTAQFGIVGLISLMTIFLSQLVMAFKKKDYLTTLRQAFPVFFLVIMLGESYLQVYGTAFLFSLFSSFLYKDFPE